jgi:hypothetical protein
MKANQFIDHKNIKAAYLNLSEEIVSDKKIDGSPTNPNDSPILPSF